METNRINPVRFYVDNNLLSIVSVINAFPELRQVTCNTSKICNEKCGKDDSVTQ